MQTYIRIYKRPVFLHIICMGKPVRSLEPQQARSRESLRRLLQASAEVLGHHGLAGATIPRIASHAGLTPGAVYRRFKNKDVLLETMVLRLMEDQDKDLRRSITAEMATEIPFSVLAEQIINGMFVSYRNNAGLLRAVRQFGHEREGTPFWRKVTKLEARTLDYGIDLLVKSRGEVKHPNPRAAIGLAVMMTVGAMWELVVTPPDPKIWKGLIPTDDKTLQRELTRSFLSYLGVGRNGG
jgi:AcrR family transcriptional regulator